MYCHRGWDLCQTGEPLTRFRRSVPVTYTICMYDTVNTLAPRGYIACICAVWCNFHAYSGIIVITHHDNVYRYYTKYLVHMIRWHIFINCAAAKKAIPPIHVIVQQDVMPLPSCPPVDYNRHNPETNGQETRAGKTTAN